ncbi:hypothetical protein D3C85_1601280 [compost metagenome]
METRVVGVTRHVGYQVSAHGAGMYFHHEAQALLAEAVGDLNLCKDVSTRLEHHATQPGQRTRVDLTSIAGRFLQHRQHLGIDVITHVVRAQVLVVVRTGGGEQQLSDLEIGHLRI